MKQFGLINYISLVVLVASLIVFSFSTIVYRSFRDVPSMLNFFEHANVYVNMAEIVKIEIEEHYPPEIQERVLVVALLDRLVDYVITPQLIERAAEPVIKLSVKFAQQPVEIVSDKVVVETALYKQQFRESLSQSGLPPFLVSAGNSVISSVPAQLTLIDNTKHPNNILARIIQARDVLRYNAEVLHYARIFLILSLVILLVNNLKRVKTLMFALALGFGIAALLIIVEYYLAESLLMTLMPVPSSEIAAAENKLAMDAVMYLSLIIRNFGILLLVFAVVFGVLWRFVRWEGVQKRIDRILMKPAKYFKYSKRNKEVSIKL